MVDRFRWRPVQPAPRTPPRHRAWTVAGVSLALAGPGLIAWLSQSLATAPETVAPRAITLALFAVLVAAVAAIATRREGLQSADVGFSRSGPLSLLLAVPLTLFLVFAYGPLATHLLSLTGPDGFGAAIARLRQLPTGYLVLATVIVAAGEEWLYRGYAIDRLEALTGRTWLAAAISLAAFGLAHLPLWGPGPALVMLLSGALLTAVYLWTRDIALLIAAHVATDLVGLVLAPQSGV